MYPPAFVTARKALKDYQIPGSKHLIKKDCQVVIPLTGLHNDERYWKDPRKFDPDRFNAEETSTRPSFAFLPFGEGPRNCIGMRLIFCNAYL
jgi:cytochrome P450 family 6